MALETKSKDRYIIEQLDEITEQFSTVRMVFTTDEFTEKWPSIVKKKLSMYSIMTSFIQSQDYDKAAIIWDRYILKRDFRDQISMSNAKSVIQLFSLHILIKEGRQSLLCFMEESFMPYTLSILGSDIGCTYAEALIQVLIDLEDEEPEKYPHNACEISLSFERIFKCMERKVITPAEKCNLINIRTDMRYDSFENIDVLGKLNTLKVNLKKLLYLKEKYYLSFQYNRFIKMSNEDVGVHIVEKMLYQENECDAIYCDEEPEKYPHNACEISLSFERIFKCMERKVITPAEKCNLINIRTDMRYDSFENIDVLGKLNTLKVNLKKLLYLKEKYYLSFQYNRFIKMSNEDVGVHIVEKMLYQENECDAIYCDVFRPYCEEFVLDFKELICSFVQKWSTQYEVLSTDIKTPFSIEKVAVMCKLIDKIADPSLQISSLEHIARAVPFNWPKELTTSVHKILMDNLIAKDIKSTLADRCKLAEICHIINIYKKVPDDIERIVERKFLFEYLVQGMSNNDSNASVETLAADIMKLYQLRHSYCKINGRLDITFEHIYTQLWIPHLLQWRYSGFTRKEPMQWLYNLPNIDAQTAVAKYSVDFLINLFKRGNQAFSTPEGVEAYMKTLSIVKTFILNYLSKVPVYQKILDKVSAIETLHSRFGILKSPKFFLESPEDACLYMEDLIEEYGVNDWENLMKIIKVMKMDPVLSYRYLLTACVRDGHLNQASSILFMLSLDKTLLSCEMISMIREIMDSIFLKINESVINETIDVSGVTNNLMLSMKIFMAEADCSDLANYKDILAFSRYHKLLDIVKEMLQCTDESVSPNYAEEPMDTSDIVPEKTNIIRWEMHPLAHLQKCSKLKYYVTLDKKSKPFTKHNLPLPMNGEHNISSVFAIASSLVEKQEMDQLKVADYIDGWRNLFNNLVMDNQYFDILNLLEIFETLELSKKVDIGINQILHNTAVGLLEKIILIPDCDLETGSAMLSSIPESYVPSILQELRNCVKSKSNPRVYINLCELVGIVYHKIPQVEMVQMLTKRYDECLWKRKLSKFGFNYTSNMMCDEVISSLIRCHVPHDILHEYCVYNNFDLNDFRLACALESAIYSSELLDSNDVDKHIDQLNKTSSLLSIHTPSAKDVNLIIQTVDKMSPYNHEGILQLIDKALLCVKCGDVASSIKTSLHDKKLVVNFALSYGKRCGQVSALECSWLASFRGSRGNPYSSLQSANSSQSNSSMREMSMIEYEDVEEKREAARKCLPQCAIQKLPFHLLCITSGEEVAEIVMPFVYNEINLQNVDKWISLIHNTQSLLCLSQTECIISAIKKHIKMVEDNNIVVDGSDKEWIEQAIREVDLSRVMSIIKYVARFVTNLKNLRIKIAYLTILKDFSSSAAENLQDGKKEELHKYAVELDKRITKYSAEKILSENGLLNSESKHFLSVNNVPEMIRYIYENNINWNDHQDRTTKMEACKVIAEQNGVSVTSIHSSIIDSILTQTMIAQVGDPDATLDVSAEVVVTNSDTDNRLECGILDDDENVSKIVHILTTGDFSPMIKKMFGIINKDIKQLPGGIATLIKVLICICRLYPRNGESMECFKVPKKNVLTVLKGAYYFYMLQNINVNCTMADLLSGEKVLDILKQIQNSPVHSTEKDFVVVNIIRDYRKKSSEYQNYMKTYVTRMIMGRKFSLVRTILDDTSATLTSEDMGNNILQFVLKTIGGILQQNPDNSEIVRDMLHFLIKYSVSSGFARPPREIGFFTNDPEASRIAQCVLNPTGN
uniref:Rod_C domain-containing protein n=1 Tax=Parastrongyloides trichosuri TaxID=131310 RepID=A0A0N4ZUM0_PARTI